MLNYRAHLQEGWTELPSSQHKGRVVLALEVPAATEEKQAAPGECPGGTACILPKGTTLPLACMLATPQPKIPISKSKSILSWEHGRCWPRWACVHVLHARVRAVSETIMWETDEIMHNVRSFQEGNSNVYKRIRWDFIRNKLCGYGILLHSALKARVPHCWIQYT